MAGERDGARRPPAACARSSCSAPTRSSDFPDRAVAEKALSAGHFVVAVTGHPSESVDAHADVVLPCAVTHERAGTTTNIEGRVSRLGPKLSAPGFAWPDWMIAAELAAALGADLGLASDNDLSDELARTAPAYAGLTQQVLHSDVAHDGILVPLTGNEDHRDDVTPIDPVALPGVESVERQGAPPRVGTGGSDPAVARACRAGQPAAPARLDRYRRHRAAAASPRPTATASAWCRAAASTTPAARSPARRRSRRSCRRWWRGPTPTTSTASAPTTGDRVKVRSARGELILAAESDEGVPRGVVAIDFNVPGGESAPPNAVATLIDSRQLVTDVRLESV